MRFDLIAIGATLHLGALAVAAPQYDDNDCGGITTVTVTIAPPVKGTNQYPSGQFPTVDAPLAVSSRTSPSLPVESGPILDATSTEHLISTLRQTVVITTTLTRIDPTIAAPVGYGSEVPENNEAASSGPRTFDNLGPSVNTELTLRPYIMTTNTYDPLGTSETQVTSTELSESSESVVFVYETIPVIPVPYTPITSSSVEESSSSPNPSITFSGINFSNTPIFPLSSTTLSFALSKPTASSLADISSSVNSSAASSDAVRASLTSTTSVHSSVEVGGGNSTTCTGHATRSDISSTIVSTPSTFSAESGSNATTTVVTPLPTLVYPTESTFTVVYSSANSTTVMTLKIPLGYGPVVLPSITASPSPPVSPAGKSSTSSFLDTSTSPTRSDDTSPASSIAVTSNNTETGLMKTISTLSAYGSTTSYLPASTTAVSNEPSSTGKAVASLLSSSVVSSESSLSTFLTSTTTYLLNSTTGSATSLTPAGFSSKPSTTSPSSFPTNCGSRGDFILNFDDLPPLAAPSDTADPMPIFNPYHQFFFGSGFVVVPPPTVPYLPSSGKLLLEYIPVPGGKNTGQVGNSYAQTSGCFNFNAKGASLGCDSKGPKCDWEISGLRYDFETKVEEPVTTQNLSTPSCPALVDCPLVPVTFDNTFLNLTSLLIKGTVDGVDKIWWMDSVDLSWFDNSCSKGLCRQRFHK